jgi:molybdopterin molybdotransferase
LRNISRGKAIRIFTGAEIPSGADAVVMQEKVSVKGNEIEIHGNVSLGLNIRRKGSHIRKGEIALPKGSLITPASVGFLSSMGIRRISVFQKPSVTILITGNELQQPGTKLTRGKIFESNAVMLRSALEKAGVENIRILFIKDNEAKTIRSFRSALKNSDFILFSGGISVGEYDFVGSVMKKEKVRTVFYKVRQKPGKPVFFGTKNKTYVFALPGNPASALVCFYLYVLPAIKIYSGHTNCLSPQLQLPLTTSFQKKSGLTHFLKANTDHKTVTILDGQESHILKSFSEANCLVRLDEKTETINEGDLVSVSLI